MNFDVPGGDRMRDLLITSQRASDWATEAGWIFRSPFQDVHICYGYQLCLTLVMLNKLRRHAHFRLSANQITWFILLVQTHILNDKQCRSKSVSFWRSQLIWIYTVCKGRAYLGSAGQGLICFYDKTSSFTLYVYYMVVKPKLTQLYIKGNPGYIFLLLYVNILIRSTSACCSPL